MGSLGGCNLDVTWGAREGAGQEVGYLREVENGGAAFDSQRSHVVGSRRHFRGCESPEPDPRLLSGLPDFGDPFSPGPHSHSSVLRMLSINSIIVDGVGVGAPASLFVIHFSTVRPGTIFSTSLGLVFRV